MAIVIPNQIPDLIRKEAYRNAEMSFYDAAKDLPSDWFVLYGVNWYIRDDHNRWNEGEADFVILSKKIGLVVVEIKGGGVGRDASGWFSIDRNGIKQSIKDPVFQAANCKHQILRYIKQKLKVDAFIPTKHMVCFPGVLSSDIPTSIDTPREMMILADDLSDLKNKILRFSSIESELNSGFIENIVKLLKPDFECPQKWSVIANRQNQVIEQLTYEQSKIWDIMVDNDKFMLSGPAGSGKTVLAVAYIKKAIEDNKNVLVLVPNKLLNEFYKTAAKSPNVIVRTYMDTRAEVNRLPETFVLDLVVIDEAHDLSEEQWLALYDIYNIEKSKKLLFIFDSNQALTRNSSFCPLDNLIPLTLTSVIRNTKQIGDYSLRYYRGNKQCTVVGPNGRDIEITEYNDNSELKDLLAKIVHHYVFDEGFNYSDIVILFGTDYKGHTLRDEVKMQNNQSINKYGIKFVDGKHYDYAGRDLAIVLMETVHAFRGLESNVIIMAGIDNLDEQTKRKTLYIGSSRAKNILHLILKNNRYTKL